MVEYPFDVNDECVFSKSSLDDIKDPNQYPRIVKKIEEDESLNHPFLKEAAYISKWEQYEKLRIIEIKKIKRKKLAKIRNLLNQKKCLCKNKNIPFELDLEWYIENLKNGCVLTKIPFDLCSNIYDKKSGPYSPYQPSIDRIDPNQGYIKSNSRLILYSLNLFKLHFSDDHLYKIAEKLLEYRLKPY